MASSAGAVPDSLRAMLRRVFAATAQTRASRSVEYFGWIDLTLGVIILFAPGLTALLLHLPALTEHDAGYLRLAGMLVCGLGLLYIIAGRLNEEGFVVASLLDRPLVPLIMAVLWWRHILPGSMAVAFSVSDFGGFLWTLFASHADARDGIEIGGPPFQGQSRGARSIEIFGLAMVVCGLVILVAPYWTASLLQLPAFPADAPNYFRLAGLLIGGLGMLFVVSGELNSIGTVFASLVVRALVVVVLVVIWREAVVPASLAALFMAGAVVGFVWTFVAWRDDQRYGCDPARVSLLAGWTAGFFGFVSGVVRNSRTFHPDGRVFRGTVRSLNPSDASLARAAQQLEGSLFMRMGMGVMKRGMPAWLADHTPDAPSIASRFYGADGGDAIPFDRRPGRI